MSDITAHTESYTSSASPRISRWALAGAWVSGYGLFCYLWMAVHFLLDAGGDGGRLGDYGYWGIMLQTASVVGVIVAPLISIWFGIRARLDIYKSNGELYGKALADFSIAWLLILQPIGVTSYIIGDVLESNAQVIALGIMFLIVGYHKHLAVVLAIVGMGLFIATAYRKTQQERVA